MPTYRRETFAERPDTREHFRRLNAAGWPDFLTQGDELHERLGATILGVAPRTMINVGTVAEWEEWTGMRFPDSGPYIVPGALQPVRIDRDKDEGRYEDPNVWMLHPSLEDDKR